MSRPGAREESSASSSSAELFPVPTAYQAPQDDRVDSRHFQGRVGVDLKLRLTVPTFSSPVSRAFSWRRTGSSLGRENRIRSDGVR